MSIHLLPGVGLAIRSGNQRKVFKCYGTLIKLREIAAVVSQLIASKKLISQKPDISPLAEKIYLEWKQINETRENSENKIKSNVSDIHLNVCPSSLASLVEGTEGQRSSPFPNLKKIQQKILEQGYRIENNFVENKGYSIFDNQISNTPIVSTSDGEIIAEGKGLTSESKLNSLIGEAVERICAMKSDYSRIVSGLTPEDMIEKGYTIPKFDCTNRDLYNENLCIDWVLGELYPVQPAWLPAEKVWHKHEPLSGVFGFDLRTTIGLASGATYSDGFANGLIESIERDAYALVMRCRICCPDIKSADILSCGPEVQDILEKLDALGIEAHFKWISLDWPIPIAHVLLVDKNEQIPAHSHGCSAALSASVAITRALLEAVQVFNGLHALASKEWISITTRGECGYIKPQHAWSDPLFRPALKHLMNKDSLDFKLYNCYFGNLNWEISSINELCDWLISKEYRIFSAAVGSIDEIKVVRVYVEGLVIPDSSIENMSSRLNFWLSKLNLPGPYTDPILS